MADRELVLCDALCFLVNKFGKQSLKVLKSAIIDFYDIDILAEAKNRLLYDVNLMELPDNVPHIPKRRNSANRLSQEADDIFALLQFIDERGKLLNLPRYVASSPETMPSCRLFEGDMKFLLARLDKLESNLAGFGSTLSAITAELHSVRQANQVLSTQHQATSCQLPSVVVGDSNNVNTVNTAATITVGKTTMNNQLISSNTSWAQRVASTPITNVDKSHPVRHPPYEYQSESTTDDQPWEEQRSRKKCRRPMSNEASNVRVHSHTRGQPVSGQASRQSGKPLIVGKLDTNDYSSHGITAARQNDQFVKKAVFYIGNVNNTVSVSMMHGFITNELSVDVLSLFETKPRQRRHLISASSSSSSDGLNKAFRLCINKEHCDQLLDDSKWPANISVSNWFFKSAMDSTVCQKNIIIHSSPNAATVVDQDCSDGKIGDVPVNKADVTLMDACNDADVDATVIVSDHSQGPTDNYLSNKNGD
jgi:hypothetical protein